MPASIKIQSSKIDLIQMIRKSRSLRSKFETTQMNAYIEKVKKMDLKEQQKVYAVLIEEEKGFALPSSEITYPTDLSIQSFRFFLRILS